MKIFPLVVTLTVLVFTGGTALSQNKKFAPGFYVNTTGDTVKGFIAFSSERPFSTFQWKSNLQDRTFNAIPFDSSRSISAGEEVFDVQPLTRSLMYIHKFDYTIVNQDSSTTAPTPLKLVYQSPRFSLYHYKNSDMENFFISDKGGPIQEFQIKYKYITDWEKKKYVYNQPRYYIHPVYRSQIIMLMNDQLTKKQRTIIETTDYEKKSLIRLLKALEE